MSTKRYCDYCGNVITHGNFGYDGWNVYITRTDMDLKSYSSGDYCDNYCEKIKEFIATLRMPATIKIELKA